MDVPSKEYAPIRKIKRKPAKADKETIKAATQARVDKFKKELHKSITDYISDKDEYRLIEEYDGGCWISKIVRMEVKKVNKNGVFYQHETMVTKPYSTNHLVEYSGNPARPDYVHDQFTGGCPVIEVGSPGQVKQLLDEI